MLVKGESVGSDCIGEVQEGGRAVVGDSLNQGTITFVLAPNTITRKFIPRHKQINVCA